MSRQEKNLNAVPPDKMRLALLAAGVVLVLVLAIGLVSYFEGKKAGKEERQSAVPIISAKAAAGAGQRVSGVSIQSYSGQVVSVEKGKITFSSSIRQSDGSYVKKDIIALLTPETELLRLDLTTPPSPTGPAADKEKISLADVKQGSSVVIESEQEPNDQSALTAKTISLLITPGSK